MITVFIRSLTAAWRSPYTNVRMYLHTYYLLDIASVLYHT